MVRKMAFGYIEMKEKVDEKIRDSAFGYLYDENLFVLLGKTQKAVKVGVVSNGKISREVWLPKSQISFEKIDVNDFDEYDALAGIVKSFVMKINVPKWLARKNNLPREAYYITRKTFEELQKTAKGEDLDDSNEKEDNRTRTENNQNNGIYHLLARRVALDPFELERYKDAGKFPMFLITNPDCEAWDKSCGKLVGLKLNKMGKVYKIDDNLYVIEYNSSSDFYKPFDYDGEINGEEITKMDVRSLDADEVTEEMWAEYSNGKWNITKYWNVEEDYY